MWTEEKLLSYIADQIEESLTLDYKAAGALDRTEKAKSQISKDVSSFANSAGGYIIYGIAEFSDQKLKHLPECITPINRAHFSKEWLEHIISSIQPRIGDVKVHPVPLKSSPGDCCYVVEISPSLTAHQASDGRYYKRYNFESVWMSDYEIRDLMNRSQTPEIEAKMILSAPHNIWAEEEGAFHIDLTNTGARMAKEYLAVVELPAAVNNVNLWIEAPSQLSTDLEGLSSWKFKLGGGLGKSPLFPEDTARLTRTVKFGGTVQHKPSNRPVQPTSDATLKVYADNMKPLIKRIPASAIWNSWQ